VRAPELRGAGGWFNTGGRALSLAGLRGRVVLLDFWTSACANCLHVLDELRPLEERYADVLTVVGVHSPKFPHEATDAAVGAAVERYGVRHPVVSDPELRTWREYAVSAWPTLVLVDPDGYVAATALGEGHAAELAEIVDELVDRYGDRLTRGTTAAAAGTAAAGTAPAGTAPVGTAAAGAGAVGTASTGDLRYPGGIALTPAGTFLVANAGHHDLVELAADGVTVLRRIGTGERGRVDGPADRATFDGPQGVTVVGGTAVVADTANHLLRAVDLATGAVTTRADLAAAVSRTSTITGPVPPVPSPWAVVPWQGGLAVAAAGVHLLVTEEGILAGTTVEGLRDGPALDGWLAQPSGLAADGDRLWFVDAETSSLRHLDNGQLTTVVGAGLFDYGLVDGPAGQARFQHPLGVTLLPDGAVAVLDTYNGAVRRYDPRTGLVDTLARDLHEPTGAVVHGTDLVVVESAAHRLTRIPLAPTVEVGEGPVTVEVAFTPPAGQRLDDSYGPPTGLTVDGETTHDLTRTVTVTARTRLSAYAASCDDTACRLTRREWELVVRPGGPTAVRLTLR
jgi:thiol-disulfide isomerase/thioredoxin